METKDDDDDATLPYNPSSENSLAADDDSIQYDNEMESKDNIGNQDNKLQLLSTLQSKESLLETSDKKLQLLSTLQSKDSLLETSVFSSAKELINVYGESPAVIVKMLTDNYCGYPHICKMLLSTIHRAKVIDGDQTGDGGNYSQDIMIQEILADYFFKKFDKNIADDLILGFHGTPQWCKPLIMNPIFRKTIINLYDKQSTSALLNLFIREISKLGFNSEISQIATKSEYFDVFKNTMTEILMKVVKKEHGAINEFIALCCRSEYTFLYAVDVLQRTELILNSSAQGRQHNSTRQSMNDSSANKRQKLDPAAESSNVVAAILKVRNLLLHLEYYAVWWSTKHSPALLRALTPSLSPTSLPYLFFGNTGISKLEGKHLFALKLVGTFAARGCSPVESVTKDLLDILKRSSASSADVNKLFSKLFSEDNQGSRPPTRQYYRLRDVSLIEALRVQLGHFKLVEVLIQALVSSCLPAQTTISSAVSYGVHSVDRVKLVHILILCSRLCGEVPLYGRAQEAIVIDHKESEREADATRADISIVDNRLVDQVIQIADICQIIADKSELRMEDLRKAKFLNGFVSRQPISSMIVLRWIDAVIHHESEGMDELPLYYFQQSRNLKAVGKNSGKGFALLPVLLQFIVTTVKNYPLQRQDAYALLVKLMLALIDGADEDDGYTAVANSQQVISAQIDVIDSLLYLVGKTFAELPLNFLAEEVHRIDKAARRHVFLSMTQLFKGPFSEIFMKPFLKLFSSSSFGLVLADTVRWTRSDTVRLLSILDTFSQTINSSGSGRGDASSSAEQLSESSLVKKISDIRLKCANN